MARPGRDSSDAYNMKHPSRGTFYLYNKNVNEIDDDLIVFENSFINLGFKKYDKTDRMGRVEVFRKDISDTNFSMDDCVFFVALSTNIRAIDQFSYASVFSDTNNPQLCDKPKLLFFIYQEDSPEQYGRIEFDAHPPGGNNTNDMLIVEIYTLDSKKTLEEIADLFKCIEYSRREISVLLMQLKDRVEITKTVNNLKKRLCFENKDKNAEVNRLRNEILVRSISQLLELDSKEPIDFYTQNNLEEIQEALQLNKDKIIPNREELIENINQVIQKAILFE